MNEENAPWKGIGYQPTPPADCLAYLGWKQLIEETKEAVRYTAFQNMAYFYALQYTW